MTMHRRRLMLAIGAALLVGGWATTRLASLHERSTGAPRNLPNHVVVWDEDQRPLYIWGIVGMTLGAGLIGFAALRPTNHKDE